MRVWSQYRDVIMANWHVGFTAFGGPAVQYQTVRGSFEWKGYCELANIDAVPREICNTPRLDRRTNGANICSYH